MIHSTGSTLNYAANNVNLLSSSETKATQPSSQTQQDTATSKSTDVSAAYSVEISAKGTTLSSQSSLSSTADTLQATVAADSSQPQQADANTQTQQPSISKAYSVEISLTGAQLSSLNSSSTSIATKASSDNSDSSDSSSTESLSQYSDSQLQQMVSNGKISQSDYNTEIAKRKAEKETTAASTAANHTVDNSEVSKSA
ncbi:MAG: hypothetical protein ABFC84_07000 [Veillonellales bacterium]